MHQTSTLSATELVPGRPFSDPGHTLADMRIMRKMARQLVDVYDDPVVCDFQQGKRPVCKSDTRGRYFRIYYIQPGLLFETHNLTVVGFFGQKRQDADVRPLLEADRRFEETFHDHPGLLSLSTVRLAGGDFGNLVLFASPEAKDHWNFNPLHYELVAKISPPYYRSIRLNNALLPRGLDGVDDLVLQRTRYIDYDSEPVWRAVRSSA